MEAKDMIAQLRSKAGMTQEELAQRVFVTRQAVSRWESGETTPGTETLKLLSKVFGVSINTILGSPHRLICQCCGMPLEDAVMSREPDGSFNEAYCQWCYADGKYLYSSLGELIDFLSEHMATPERPSAQVRAYMEEHLPKLDHWRKEG